jgi:hypothetical protein
MLALRDIRQLGIPPQALVLYAKSRTSQLQKTTVLPSTETEITAASKGVKS